jgi:uncharacterized membrane protein YccF (DUF307 family)
MSQPPPPVHVYQASNNPGCLVRGIWYIFIGWWLSGIFIAIGWLLMVTVIFIPLGLWFLHRVPWAQTLRPRNDELTYAWVDGELVVTQSGVPQHPWFVRLVYIVFVGWWWGAIWLAIAWVMGLLIVTLPISILMIDRSPAMVSLQRN